MIRQLISEYFTEVSQFLSLRRKERLFHMPVFKGTPKSSFLIPEGRGEACLKFGQLRLVGILPRLVSGDQHFS